MDREALDRRLAVAFGGAAGERRVVARAAGDLADDGRLEGDLGVPVTADLVVEGLADAPDGTGLVDRWNWWMGSLEAAFGGYEPFTVRRYRNE